MRRAAPAVCLLAHLRVLAGASDVFKGSMVTYANVIKHQWLGVEDEVLERFGAVSHQCVEQMLTGIQKTSC